MKMDLAHHRYEEISKLLISQSEPTFKTLELISTIINKLSLFKNAGYKYKAAVYFHVKEESDCPAFDVSNEPLISAFEVILKRKSMNDDYGTSSFLMTHIAASRVTAKSRKMQTTVFKLPYFDRNTSSRLRASAFRNNDSIWKSITEKLMEIVLLSMRVEYTENNYAVIPRDAQVSKIRSIISDLEQIQVLMLGKVIRDPTRALTFSVDPLLNTLFTGFTFCPKVSPERVDVECIDFQEHKKSYIMHLFSLANASLEKIMDDEFYLHTTLNRMRKLNRYQSVPNWHWGHENNLLAGVEKVLTCCRNSAIRLDQVSENQTSRLVLASKAVVECMKHGLIVMFHNYFIQSMRETDDEEWYDHFSEEDNPVDHLKRAFEAIKQLDLNAFNSAIAVVPAHSLTAYWPAAGDTLLGAVAKMVQISHLEGPGSILTRMQVQAHMVQTLQQHGCSLKLLLSFQVQNTWLKKFFFLTFLSTWEYYIDFPRLKRIGISDSSVQEVYTEALKFRDLYKSMGAVTTPWRVIDFFRDSLQLMDVKYQDEHAWLEHGRREQQGDLLDKKERWLDAAVHPFPGTSRIAMTINGREIVAESWLQLYNPDAATADILYECTWRSGRVPETVPRRKLRYVPFDKHMDVYDLTSKRMGNIVDSEQDNRVFFDSWTYKVQFPDEVEPVGIFFTDLRFVPVPVHARVQVISVENDNFDKYGYVSAVKFENEHNYTVTLSSGEEIQDMYREDFCHVSIPKHSYVVVDKMDSFQFFRPGRGIPTHLIGRIQECKKNHSNQFEYTVFMCREKQYREYLVEPNIQVVGIPPRADVIITTEGHTYSNKRAVVQRSWIREDEEVTYVVSVLDGGQEVYVNDLTSKDLKWLEAYGDDMKDQMNLDGGSMFGNSGFNMSFSTGAACPTTVNQSAGFVDLTKDLQQMVLETVEDQRKAAWHDIQALSMEMEQNMRQIQEIEADLDEARDPDKLLQEASKYHMRLIDLEQALERKRTAFAKDFCPKKIEAFQEMMHRDADKSSLLPRQS